MSEHINDAARYMTQPTSSNLKFIAMFGKYVEGKDPAHAEIIIRVFKFRKIYMSGSRKRIVKL